MSAPKQVTKRRKLEKKRQRKRVTQLKRQKQAQIRRCQPDCLELAATPNAHVEITKMSDVLKDFVRPLAGSADGRDTYERLLWLGMVAWNAALLPEYRRAEMIDDLMEQGMRWESAWERQACCETVDRLVARKLERFAGYQRPILAFQLDELGDGDYYLSVASGLVC